MKKNDKTKYGSLTGKRRDEEQEEEEEEEEEERRRRFEARASGRKIAFLALSSEKHKKNKKLNPKTTKKEG